MPFHRKKTICNILLPFFTFLLICQATSPVLANDQLNAETTYSFGVFPYLPPSRLQELFAPIAADFQRHLKAKVTLHSKGNYGNFRKELEKETYDIAFVQPFDYVLAHDLHHYLPIARRGEMLRAVFVVNKKSDYRNIRQLKGKTIANPSRYAAVSKLTTLALQQSGIAPFTDVERVFTKNHFSCMQKVLFNKADACATAYQALAHFENKQINGRFNIIGKSTSISHSLFVINARIPSHIREIISKTILNWPNSSDGRQLLENGNFIPFVKALDSDYESVRTFKGTKPQ